MSIVKLDKVTLVGHLESKTQVIEELQALGCLHLIPLAASGKPEGEGGDPSPTAREALQFLASCPYQRRQVSDASRFDAVAVERRALELKKRLFELREDRDHLVERAAALEPWGDFSFAPLEEMGGLRFWFYVVPRRQARLLDTLELPWEAVASDERNHYVIVVATEEPANVPFERTLAGPLSPHDLRARLEDVELEIEDVEAERGSLTRWCTLFARSVDGLEDRAARQYAAEGTLDLSPVYALQAWAPSERLAAVREYAATRGLALEIGDPAADEQPPTLLSNPPVLRAGEDLVTFYRTPAYELWDPSSVVFFSFALFFSMIISDAGYGLMISAITVWLWRRLGESDKGREWRILLTTLSFATLLYGILAGSYFGVTPAADSLLGRFHVLDISDTNAMMALSIVVGGGHIMLANLTDARRRRSPAGLAPLGWAVLVGGGLLFGSTALFETLPRWPGQCVMVIGLLLILGFSGHGKPLTRRMLSGVMALSRLTKIFGDVLSYLRLFALGLASASLAVAFNGMAADVRIAFPGPGLGLLFALLILGVGHILNFVLAVMSGAIHGLRLNVIEFFDWSVQDEGNAFRVFRRKGNN